MLSRLCSNHWRRPQYCCFAPRVAWAQFNHVSCRVANLLMMLDRDDTRPTKYESGGAHVAGASHSGLTDCICPMEAGDAKTNNQLGTRSDDENRPVGLFVCSVNKDMP
jgi:hypothetical protein